MKDKKEKKEKEKSLTKVKEKRAKFITFLKKRWLVSGINTLLLIAILVAIFVLINIGVRKWNPTPIDCTTSKDYSLTEDSKNRLKDIDKDVNIYFVNWDSVGESEVAYYFPKIVDQYNLAEQYTKISSKIKVQKIDTNKDVEFSKKYNISSGDYHVIIESGKNNRNLEAIELVDTTNGTYLTEQKITSAIVNAITDKTNKAYFLAGYSEFDSEKNLTTLTQYLKDEALTYENLSILNKKEVPADCDTLIIMTPNKDFDDITTDAILKYIKKGGNILWFNGITENDKDLKNVNKILAEYGVNKFEKGIIYETDKNRVYGYYTWFAPVVEGSSILKDFNDGTILLFEATKVNINTDKLEELKVTKTDLLTSSEKSYYSKNLTSQMDTKSDEKGSFIVGAELIKTISEAQEATEGKEAKEAVESKLIIYGNDLFVSDSSIPMAQGYNIPAITFLNNKDVVLNSIAYLTKNDQNITIRKSYTDALTSFTPTDLEKQIIITIIFAVPVLIIIIGIMIWVIRRRRN